MAFFFGKTASRNGPGFDLGASSERAYADALFWWSFSEVTGAFLNGGPVIGYGGRAGGRVLSLGPHAASQRPSRPRSRKPRQPAVCRGRAPAARQQGGRARSRDVNRALRLATWSWPRFPLHTRQIQAGR